MSSTAAVVATSSPTTSVSASTSASRRGSSARVRRTQSTPPASVASVSWVPQCGSAPTGCGSVDRRSDRRRVLVARLRAIPKSQPAKSERSPEKCARRWAATSQVSAAMSSGETALSPLGRVRSQVSSRPVSDSYSSRHASGSPRRARSTRSTSALTCPPLCLGTPPCLLTRIVVHGQGRCRRSGGVSRLGYGAVGRGVGRVRPVARPVAVLVLAFIGPVALVVAPSHPGRLRGRPGRPGRPCRRCPCRRPGRGRRRCRRGPRPRAGALASRRHRAVQVRGVGSEPARRVPGRARRRWRAPPSGWRREARRRSRRRGAPYPAGPGPWTCRSVRPCRTARSAARGRGCTARRRVRRTSCSAGVVVPGDGLVGEPQVAGGRAGPGRHGGRGPRWRGGVGGDQLAGDQGATGDDGRDARGGERDPERTGTSYAAGGAAAGPSRRRPGRRGATRRRRPPAREGSPRAAGPVSPAFVISCPGCSGVRRAQCVVSGEGRSGGTAGVSARRSVRLRGVQERASRGVDTLSRAAHVSGPVPALHEPEESFRRSGPPASMRRQCAARV